MITSLFRIKPYCLGKTDSNLTEKPVVWPSSSALSWANLSATETAEILLGCVTIMLQNAPFCMLKYDSKMYWGIWVVLPI